VWVFFTVVPSAGQPGLVANHERVFAVSHAIEVVR
jgi:hypothetical protein